MIYLGSGDDSMKYYLIGIKGAGMSALALLLNDLGYEVIGYDGVGKAHQNSATGEDLIPHVHDKTVPGDLRKPNIDEIP